MSTYTGTKTIKATPMNRLEHKEYKVWDLPADENGADEGCLVEYLDGDKPNQDKHTGYLGWSPEDWMVIE